MERDLPLPTAPKSAILARELLGTPRMSEEMSCARRLAAVLGLGLAVAGIPALGAQHSFDGVYSGTRVLTKGSGQMCPAEENVSVTIHGQTLTFTNSALKTFTISFKLNP